MLLYSVRDFMETVCTCRACFARALGVLLQQQCSSCTGLQSSPSVCSVSELLEKHGLQKPVSFVKHTKDDAEEARKLMIRLTRHTGRKLVFQGEWGRRGEGQWSKRACLPALWQQGAVVFTLQTVYTNTFVELVINVISVVAAFPTVRNLCLPSNLL